MPYYMVGFFGTLAMLIGTDYLLSKKRKEEEEKEWPIFWVPLSRLQRNTFLQGQCPQSVFIVALKRLKTVERNNDILVLRL